jgi:methylthioribose-1-phosphate isomerase
MRVALLQGETLTTAQSMWVRGTPVEDIAAACGCSITAIYKASRRCKFPPRRRGQCGVMEMTEEDPTPLAIQAAAIRIRCDHMAERRATA